LLGCALVVGLACSGDSSTPTAPVTAADNLQSVTSGVSAGKDYYCHWNESKGTGVVVEVTLNNSKTHNKHLAADIDCVCPNTPSKSGGICNTFDGTDDLCDNNCPSG
jgi:hypothetical protein